MSSPNLRAEIILIAREWAKQCGISEDKARVLVDRIWPAIEKELLAPEVRDSGPTKE